MKKILLSSVITIGLLTLSLNATNANAAAGWVSKPISCPDSITIVPPGGRLEISDIVISTDGATAVTLRFKPGNFIIMTVYLDANETVVANFTGQLESEEEMSLRAECDGNANVSVTILGTEVFAEDEGLF